MLGLLIGSMKDYTAVLKLYLGTTLNEAVLIYYLAPPDVECNLTNGAGFYILYLVSSV